MPEYLAPGVYVEEIERGPKPIEGVATSTAAFLGRTARGPGKPRLITSFSGYMRWFGNVFDPAQYMPHAVKAFFDNGGRRCYIARIVGPGSTTSETAVGNYKFQAAGPETSGNRILVRLEKSTTEKKDGNPVGFRLRVFYWDSGTPFDPIKNDKQLPRPVVAEDFDDIRTDPAHPDYYDKRINHGNSSLITVAVPDGEAPPTKMTAQALAGGKDGGPITVVEFDGIADKIDDRRGLAALDLDPYRDVAVVYAPAVPTPIALAVIGHCERNRFRFAVIDSAKDQADKSGLIPRNDLETKYGAFYYPWIKTSDPLTGKRIKTPPGGPVCGIYARSDNTRGVWKAPANEGVVGALDLEYDIDHGTQEILNPRGVNVIRRFPGRGIRVWGARTLSSDTLWKYVNVRRLFIFIESSIFRHTQWVVFEPNDQRLWARVKQSVTLFLRTQWREGALFGEKEEDAFFVSIGPDTMTEDDILNGRLIVEIGIAPVRPAEFVIFRLFQKTQEANN